MQVTARRKFLYGILHPETEHGGDRKSSRQNGDLIAPPADRFTKATAKGNGARRAQPLIIALSTP